LQGRGTNTANRGRWSELSNRLGIILDANEIRTACFIGEFSVFDTRTDKRVADIRIAGHAGKCASEKSGTRVFLTIGQANQVAVMDRKKEQVVATWLVTGVSAAVDEAHHRLFVASRTPPSVIVLDSESGRVVTTLAGGDLPQGIFSDAALWRICVSCGEGFVSVYQQLDAGHYDTVARIPTAPDARTSLLVPELKRFYLELPRHDNREAEV